MIEGIDYFVYYVRFPNRANPANILLNDDGTYDVYVNTLYPESTWATSVEHELAHAMDEHFYIDIPIRRIEAQADGEARNVVLHPPAGKIPVFNSEQAFAHWVSVVAAQGGIDPRTM